MSDKSTWKIQNENLILSQNMFYASSQKIQDILVSLFLLKEYCKEFVSKVTLNQIFLTFHNKQKI